MKLHRVEAPLTEPISLAEAKAQLRVEHDEDDALISALIVTAREQAEHITRRAFVTQTWGLFGFSFPRFFTLRRAPIIEIVSLAYTDADGAAQVLDPAFTRLDKFSEPGFLYPAAGHSWPQTLPDSEVVLTYRAGYGEAADVPQSIKQWMLLIITTWYDQRDTLKPGSVFVLPRTHWDALLDPYVISEYI